MANDHYSYRCFHRVCKVLFTINKGNLEIIIHKKEKPENTKITYNTKNKQNTYTKNIKNTNFLNITTNKEKK